MIMKEGSPSTGATPLERGDNERVPGAKCLQLSPSLFLSHPAHSAILFLYLSQQSLSRFHLFILHTFSHVLSPLLYIPLFSFSAICFYLFTSFPVNSLLLVLESKSSTPPQGPQNPSTHSSVLKSWRLSWVCRTISGINIATKRERHTQALWATGSYAIAGFIAFALYVSYGVAGFQSRSTHSN